MRVTFDTNTLDPAVRPERFPKDPAQPNYFKVKQAIVSGIIQGFFSETIISLEGIQKDDRAAVFGSTAISISEGPASIDHDTGKVTIQVNLNVEQLGRKPLHAEAAARVRTACGIGMRLLKAPSRIGGFQINDLAKVVFVLEEDEASMAKRQDVCITLAREIEGRNVGLAPLKKLAAIFAARDNADEPWFQSLSRAKDVHEENAVKRAFAEWADGDSMAAHIAYGMDYFCTNDQGKSAATSSILDATNRAWLTATFGVQFITINQLAAMLS